MTFDRFGWIELSKFAFLKKIIKTKGGNAATGATFKGYKFWRCAGLSHCCHEGRFTFSRALNFVSTCSGYLFAYGLRKCLCVKYELRMFSPDYCALVEIFRSLQPALMLSVVG